MAGLGIAVQQKDRITPSGHEVLKRDPAIFRGVTVDHDVVLCSHGSASLLYCIRDSCFSEE